MRNLVILLAVLCASCGTALPTVKPYKLDVQQGNVVTSKMLLQLRPGMTKSQVRFIMGTPLIQDSFHGNRWDYVYQMRESGKVTEQRRVILDFENDLLKTVRGDVIPSAGDKASADENIGTRVINPSAPSEEKSLVNKLKFWQKDEAEIAKAKAEENAKATEKAKAEERAKAEEKTKAEEKVKAEEKAKLEADEAAKKAASLNVESTTPVEPAQSMLAVPIEIAAIVEAPVMPATNAVPVAEAVVFEIPEVIMPAVKTPAVIENPIVQVEATLPEPVKAKITVAPDHEALLADASPVKHENYNSPTRMTFDRTLKFVVAEPAIQPVLSSRAGNKIAPQPKDLPAESTPSFFDKMLEKIGF